MMFTGDGEGVRLIKDGLWVNLGDGERRWGISLSDPGS